MANRNNLSPKKVIDKNGVERTVYVKNNHGVAASRVASVPPPTRTSRELEMLDEIEVARNLLTQDEFKRFPISMQDGIIRIANSPFATERVRSELEEVAEICEAKNFHHVAGRIWSASSIADLKKNQSGPIKYAYLVASDPDAPALILERIWNEGPEYAAPALAGNPSTPPSVIGKILRESPESEVYASAGRNPSTPANLLHLIAQGDNWQGRYEVALNSNTADLTFALLEKDESPRVQEAVREARFKRPLVSPA